MTESVTGNGRLLRLRWVGVGVLWAWLSAPALAVEPSETDPRKIMQAVHDRPDGDKRTSRMTMTVTDAAGRERTRTVQARAMDFDDESRSLLIFEAPAEVRNTGWLAIDYEGDKDDDQWLYLPSLHKPTRISTSDKSGSFLGTDITYADMTSRNLANYEYKLVAASEKVDGEDCWVIESRPRVDKEAKETGYVKSTLWISKSKLMPLQVKNWVKEGRKLKYMKFGAFTKVDGIWVSKSLAVRVLKGKKVESTTTLVTSDVRLNQASVKAEDFTQQRLEKGL